MDGYGQGRRSGKGSARTWRKKNPEENLPQGLDADTPRAPQSRAATATAGRHHPGGPGGHADRMPANAATLD